MFHRLRSGHHSPLAPAAAGGVSWAAVRAVALHLGRRDLQHARLVRHQSFDLVLTGSELAEVGEPCMVVGRFPLTP